MKTMLASWQMGGSRLAQGGLMSDRLNERTSGKQARAKFWELAPKKAKAPSRHRGLRSKMAIIVIVLIAVLMGADALWNYGLQRTQAENEAREKAEVLASEMRAMWDFIDMNQDVINRDENGNFRTKTLVCVVAAKSVSTLFTSDTDYIIRFTGETPDRTRMRPTLLSRRPLMRFVPILALLHIAALEPTKKRASACSAIPNRCM